MFEILAQYLFEFKKLTLPRIGVFTLSNEQASSDLAAATISAPAWSVGFTPLSDHVNAGSSAALVSWLAINGGISIDEAGNSFDQFTGDLQNRLDKDEAVIWPQLGLLKKMDGQIVFEPERSSISPFTPVSARKIAREHTSHQTLVGDRETTTAQMREQLLLPEEKKRSSSFIMWVLLGIALIAAAWFFSQKGCKLSATGNQQKVESTQPADTYQLQ